jgi:hypothetical protein
MASAPTYSPLHSFGMYLRRCASLPLWKIFCTRDSNARHTKGRPSRSARDLLHRHHVRQEAHAGAAVFGRDGHAEQAHLAELLPQVGGKQVVAIDAIGARGDFLFGERMHGFAQQIDVFSKRKGTHSLRFILQADQCRLQRPIACRLVFLAESIRLAVDLDIAQDNRDLTVRLIAREVELHRAVELAALRGSGDGIRKRIVLDFIAGQCKTRCGDRQQQHQAQRFCFHADRSPQMCLVKRTQHKPPFTASTWRVM